MGLRPVPIGDISGIGEQMLLLGLGAPVIDAADQPEQRDIARTLDPAPGGDEERQGADPPGHVLRNIGGVPREGIGAVRSEEHTSELQSLMRISYAVFWLKKKKKQ